MADTVLSGKVPTPGGMAGKQLLNRVVKALRGASVDIFAKVRDATGAADVEAAIALVTKDASALRTAAEALGLDETGSPIGGMSPTNSVASRLFGSKRSKGDQLSGGGLTI